MENTSNRLRHFTQSKKQLIINEHYSSGISIPVLARKYGVHAIALYNWKRQMTHKKEESFIDLDYVQKLIEDE